MNKGIARVLRKSMTDAERALWRHLRDHRLEGFKFRRQQPLGPYIADFSCFAKKLIVELDGGQHAEQTAAESARTTWVESQGFRVLRFWNHEVLTDIEAVKELIRQALTGGSPSPAPSPSGGEGTEPEAKGG